MKKRSQKAKTKEMIIKNKNKGNKWLAYGR
jgi:hypothetical protein